MSETDQSGGRFIVVLLSTLPPILGTAFFLSGVIVDAVFGRGPAPPVSFDPATRAEQLKLTLAFALFLACYFGAAFGPLMLPLAGSLALQLSRTAGARRKAIWAWTFVTLGVVAAAVFWGWLIWLDIFV